MIDLTIVVPVHERYDHMAQTLMAIHDQLEHSPMRSEVIVVNDGSTSMLTLTHLNALFHERLHYHYITREPGWRNPGRAQNVGLRTAQGEFTVICHNGIVPRTPQLFTEMWEALRRQPAIAVLARIEENGAEVPGSQRDYFLLGGMKTNEFQSLRGYDEDFTEYGFEDDDLALRLHARGIRFVHRSDLLGEHLWHERGEYYGRGMENMRRLHYEKIRQLNAGEIGLVRNLNREWGAEGPQPPPCVIYDGGTK